MQLQFKSEMNERIRHDLLERGLKFLSFSGIHHCFYDGAAQMHNYGQANVCISILLSLLLQSTNT